MKSERGRKREREHDRVKGKSKIVRERDCASFKDTESERLGLVLREQCDRVVRLFFNIWTLTTLKICPIAFFDPNSF